MKFKPFLFIIFSLFFNISYTQVLSTYSIVEMDTMQEDVLVSPRSPWRYSRTDSTLYRFNYNTLTWQAFSSGGGAGIDTSFVRNDSIFIVSGLDTIFSGTATWLKPELEAGNEVEINGGEGASLTILLNDQNSFFILEDQFQLKAVYPDGDYQSTVSADLSNPSGNSLAVDIDSARVIAFARDQLDSKKDNSVSIYYGTTETARFDNKSDFYLLQYPGTKEDTAQYFLGVQSDGKVIPQANQNGVASGTTDGSGDITITFPGLMPDATYTAICIPDSITGQYANVQSKNASSMVVRVFNNAGAVTSTGVVINWIVKDY